MSIRLLFDGVRPDASIALRSLRANPGFTSTVVLSLALAVGASASAFSVIDAVRFRALPFADADRLVVLSEDPARGPRPGIAGVSACKSACTVSFVTYQKTLSNHHFQTLDAITAHVSGVKALTVNGESEAVLGTLISDNLFPLLRATPERGRLFSVDDNRLGSAPVAILSHELWATRFGQDPDILGTAVQLSDTRYTVVGIMPPGFDFEAGSRFWLPAVPSLDPSTRPSIRTVTVIGRLSRGATIEQARAELAGVDITTGARPAGSSAPARLELNALPLRERYTAATQNYDLIFFGVVLCVVLIACANLTNLLLARGLDQRREFAVRAALGAEPRRLARHVVAQHTVLALAGAIVGLAFARVFLGVIRSLTVLNTFRPTGMDYRVDNHVIAFAAIVTVVAAAVMSIVPVKLVLAADGQEALRESASSAPGGERGTRAQRIFVAAQVACAVTLLISAGLTVRTVLRLSRVDLGFDATQLVQATPSLPHDWRVKEKYLPAITRIDDVLRALPGVHTTATRATIALGSARAPAEITLAGDATPLGRDVIPANVLAVDSGYFAALRIPMARGRAFDATDRDASTPVAIVNQWAANHWWPDRDPVGAQLRIDTLPGQSVTVTVVGVVRDNKAGRGSLLLASDGPELYRPFAQVPSAFPTFFVRVDGAVAPVLRPMRAQLGEIVLNRPVSTSILADAVKQQLEGVETTARQIFAFAAVGLLLALIGVYGVLSYSVRRRTRELGIRRALGASVANVYRLIVRDAVIVTAPGVVVGVLGALYVGRFVAPLLYGTPTHDVATFIAIVLLVLVTAVASALIPATRAARVSPLTAIRGH